MPAFMSAPTQYKHLLLLLIFLAFLPSLDGTEDRERPERESNPGLPVVHHKLTQGGVSFSYITSLKTPTLGL